MNKLKKLYQYFYFKLVFIAPICLLCACSHNNITYSDGIGIETTFRPDSGNFGLTFRYGKILSATVRENTEIEMAGDNNSSLPFSSSSTSTSKTEGALKIKIGRQISGYFVDAVKANSSNEFLYKYTLENFEKNKEVSK